MCNINRKRALRLYTGLTALKSGLKSLFCNLSVPLKLHYQVCPFFAVLVT